MWLPLMRIIVNTVNSQIQKIGLPHYRKKEICEINFDYILALVLTKVLGPSYKYIRFKIRK